MQRLVDQEQQGEQEEGGEEAEIQNWSSTHSVTTRAYLQPDSVEKVRHASAKALSFVDEFPFQSAARSIQMFTLVR